MTHFPALPAGRPYLDDRVEICIPDHKWSEWATGSAECLHGLTGKVVRVSTMYPPPSYSSRHNTPDTRGATRVLVEFDSPAPTWWKDQTPPAAWWFDLDELCQLREETP